MAVNRTTPTPETTAVRVWEPAVGPRVHRVAASPSPSVGPLSGAALPPPSPTTQVTGVPGTGLPDSSSRRTTSSCGSGVPATALCASPETASRAAALPAAAVWTKVTGEPASPSAAASVRCSPADGPRVRSTAARPSSSVSTTSALTLPPPCARQVTGTPGMGLPKTSATCTTRGSGSGAPAGAACASPERSAIPAASAGTAVKRTTALGSGSLDVTVTVPSMPPTWLPSTTSKAAIPSAPVWPVLGSTSAPLPWGKSKTTVAPVTGRPLESVTSTATGWANGSPTRPT